MVELADAADSKSADRKVVGVRPPLPAPKTMNLREMALPDWKAIPCSSECGGARSVRAGRIVLESKRDGRHAMPQLVG